MKCLNCHKEMKLVVENHRYKECGLDNIVIVNMKKYVCSSCDEEYLRIPNMETLHRAIAEHIASDFNPLNNKEFRFLRAYLGFSGAFFAKLIGVTRESVSRWENGKAAIPRHMELLIRVLALYCQPDRNYNLHDQILNGEKKPNSFCLKLELNKNKEWEVKKAA